jgi:hypothetical protein
MSDELKSAVELALEKLDRETGESVPRLTDEQKAAIAELRSKYEARIAELEIATQGKIRKARETGDYETMRKIQAEMADERRRLESSRDREIEKIRHQGR